MSSSSKPKQLPYIRHKRWGTAYTYVRDEAGERRQVYLGKADSTESWQRYYAIGAQVAGGCAQVVRPPSDGQHADQNDVLAATTIERLVSQFLQRAQTRYRDPTGNPSSEFRSYIESVRLLLNLYRDELTKDFDAQKLEKVRDAMKTTGVARSTINNRVRRLKRIFKWGVVRKLVPVRVHQELACLEGLRQGEARETPKVRVVPEDHVDAVLPHLSRQVAAMVQVQLLTGARPSEIRMMCTGELDRSGEVWICTPVQHKNAHRDQQRVIAIGPRAQIALRPFLKEDPLSPLFSPQDELAERTLRRRQERQTKLWPSHANRPKKLSPLRKPRRFYSQDSYRTSIRRACIAADVAIWTPNQLRHLAATKQGPIW